MHLHVICIHICELTFYILQSYLSLDHSKCFSRRRNVPRRKNLNQHNLSKFMYKKIPMDDLPLRTMKVTLHALRWIFMLIFLFITVGIFVLFLTGGENYIQIILGYSIAGFFTFFMGYFGWVLAQSILEMMAGKEDRRDHSLSYYVGRKKKYRF